jgi:hypothetical protein
VDRSWVISEYDQGFCGGVGADADSLVPKRSHPCGQLVEVAIGFGDFKGLLVGERCVVSTAKAIGRRHRPASHLVELTYRLRG